MRAQNPQPVGEADDIETLTRSLLRDVLGLTTLGAREWLVSGLLGLIPLTAVQAYRILHR